MLDQIRIYSTKLPYVKRYKAQGARMLRDVKHDGPVHSIRCNVFLTISFCLR